jgi:hypothetical protein
MQFIPILIAYLIGISTYGMVAYNSDSVYSINLYYIIGTCSFILPLILKMFIRKSVQFITWTYYIGFMGAVCMRITYDAFYWDSVSHGIAPLEFIICSALSYIPAHLGTRLSVIMLKVNRIKDPYL